MRYKYSDEQLAEAVANSTSISGVIRYLGGVPHGSIHPHFKKRVESLGLDTSHFLNGGQSSAARTRRTAESIFARSGRRERSRHLARALLEICRPYACEKCGLGGEWQGQRILLQVDHINGDSTNNSADNLRFLCPNCHSQCWETNRPHKNKPKREPNKCGECAVEIQKNSRLCKTCNSRFNPKAPKIVWPPVLELEARLRVSNYSALGRELGVSDNAIRKRLKRKAGRD